MRNQIFSTDSPKAIKADKYGYLNAIHYMAPADLSGVDLCPFRSKGCTKLCLGAHSGAAIYYPTVLQSRIAKAKRFMADRHGYMADVVKAINTAKRQAKRKGKTLCVRLNGSTDISFEGIRDASGRNVFELFPDVQFVDYTKNWTRFNRALPSNLHLTFSRSETNETKALELLARGVNVAVVFADTAPLWWNGYRVIDGDEHDLRHLDPRGARGFVIALSPKGPKAKKDTSGFVVK